MTQEERLINLYEALGYCDVYETKEKIYDIVQKDSVKVLWDDDTKEEAITIRMKVDMHEFKKEVPLIIVTNEEYMPLPSQDYILINNTIYVHNTNKRLYNVEIVKMK